MKRSKFIYPVIVFWMLGSASCDDFEYKPAGPYEGKFDLSVNEFVTQRYDSLQMLNEALNITGLSETIESGQYTIFAPYNSSFESYLNDKDYQSLQDVPKDDLIMLLQNHIISGKKKASAFPPDGRQFETLSGKILAIHTAEDTRGLSTAYVIIAEGRTILTSNIELRNVILHAYQDDLLAD